MVKLNTNTYSLEPLTRSYSGYYKELLIQNCTSDTIIVIDKENNKLAVEPTGNSAIGPEAVNIYVRSTVGPTATPTNTPLKVPGKSIRIPRALLLENESLYIKEIDMVICTQAASINAYHPATAVDYDTMCYEIRKHLAAAAAEVPTISLLANDPSGRYNRLYTTIGDMTVSIPVTKLAGSAYLQIIFSAEGKSSQYTIDLEEFFNSTENIVELDDCPISFLTTNRAVAERASTSGEYRKVSQASMNKMLESQKKSLEEMHKRELQIAQQELDAAKADLAKVKADLSRVNFEYDAFTGNVSARSKMHENDVRVLKSANSATEEKWKTVGVYGALALGAITLIIKAVQLGSKTGLI